MNLAYSIRLQRRIRIYATIGILLTGLLVAIATAIPLYHDAHDRAATAYVEDARARARSAGQFIGKAHDIARQIASRSGIRDQLEAYNRWEIDRSELVEYSAPRIRDALSQGRNIAGLVRLDKGNDPVIEIGQQIPASLLQIASSKEPVACGPLRIDDKIMLLVSAPVLSRDGARAGTDILSFEMAALDELLNNEPKGEHNTRQLLFNSTDQAVVEFNRLTPGGRLLDAGQPEQRQHEGEIGDQLEKERPGRNIGRKEREGDRRWQHQQVERQAGQKVPVADDVALAGIVVRHRGQRRDRDPQQEQRVEPDQALDHEGPRPQPGPPARQVGAAQHEAREREEEIHRHVAVRGLRDVEMEKGDAQRGNAPHAVQRDVSPFPGGGRPTCPVHVRPGSFRRVALT